MRKPYRSQRVGEQIKRELALIFRTEKGGFADHMITVTEVRVTRDMRSADVWVSVLGEPPARQDVLKTLETNAGRLRHLLAGRVVLRRVPELRFRLDDTLNHAERIDNLLKRHGLLSC